MSVDFNFFEYISKMSDEDLEKFAQVSGTTPNYIKRHLIYKKKIPRPEMIEALVFASEGYFSKHDFVHWLYGLDKA